MAEMEPETRVPAGELTAIVAAIFARCGMDDTDAALLADSLVAAT
jgi:LDH2 family malate/lactate/ureidoglycolate dehydrogenase